ncbi:MAG: glycine zipper 2TM domain-containing protein [Asticcacaulis sp.]|uniref:glycine zipper 2TM domain-containing protein n=1 Tax=Asticcacaulis sp. TaxID=1872648 RepID=UPI0039E22AE0
MTRILKTATAAIVSLGLIAGSAVVPNIADAQTYYRCKYEQKKAGNKGAVIGAIAGGLLGSQISKNERGLGTVGGAVVGGYAGSKIAKNSAKRRCVDEVAYRTRTTYETDRYGRRHKVVYRYVRE